MAITVRCECGRKYRLPEGVSGKGKCSHCGRLVTVRPADSNGGEPDASSEVDSSPHEPAPAKKQKFGTPVNVVAALVVLLVSVWLILFFLGPGAQQELKVADPPMASDKPMALDKADPAYEPTRSDPVVVPVLIPEPPDPKEERIAGWPNPLPSPAVVPKFGEPTEFERRPVDLQYDVSPIVAVDISRDGKRLAGASLEVPGRAGELTVWDLETKQVLLALKMPTMPGMTKFSPNGDLLAVACTDRTVKLVDLASGEVTASLDTHGATCLLAFLNDGAQLATGGYDGVFKLWDVKSRTAVKTQPLGGRSNYVIGISSDGQSLATVDRKWVVTIWDAQTGRAVSKLDTKAPGTRCAVFSPEEDLIATAGFTETVQLWDVKEGRLKSTVTSPAAPVSCLRSSPDGKTLAVAGLNGRVSLLEFPSGRELATINAHSEGISCLAFAANGKTLASGSSDKSVKIWELDRFVGREAGAGKTAAGITPAKPGLAEVVGSLFGAQNKSLDQPLAVFTRLNAKHIDSPQSVLALAVSPDGATLASAHGDNSVRIRAAQNGNVQKVLTAHSDAVTSLAFSADGTILASAGRDETAKLWDISSGEPRATLEGHSGTVSSIAFSPNGKTVATAGADKTTRLWDIETAKQLASASEHVSPVNAVAFSPSGEVLATASDDRSIKLWKADALTEEATLTGHTASIRTLAFSPDGQTLASGGEDQSIRLWDVGLREVRATCEWPSQEIRRMSDGKIVTESQTLSSQIGHLAFSPEGETLASVCTNGCVMLWDPQTGAHRNTLRGFGGVATSLVFAPDTNFLVSASADTTIKRWRARQPRGQLAELPIGLYAVSAPAGSYEFDVAEDGRVSKKSVVIDGTGRRAGIIVGPVAMDRTKRYIARGWARVEGSPDAKATLTLDFYDAEGQQIVSSSPGMVESATSDWQRIALDLTAADNPPNAEFVAVGTVVTGPGRAWFDDLALIAVDPADTRQNVLANGGFESIAGPSLMDWGLHTRDATESFMGPSDASPKTGRRCLHVKGKATFYYSARLIALLRKAGILYKTGCEG